jgi:hypothetical protein
MMAVLASRLVHLEGEGVPQNAPVPETQCSHKVHFDIEYDKKQMLFDATILGDASSTTFKVQQEEVDS